MPCRAVPCRVVSCRDEFVHVAVVVGVLLLDVRREVMFLSYFRTMMLGWRKDNREGRNQLMPNICFA